MHPKKFTFLVIIFLCWGSALTIQAQVPQLLNYQGVLIDPDSGERLSGTYAMTFSIYGEETGGTALWTETQNVVAQNGLFNVLLGSVTDIPFDLFDGSARYLGVQVGSDAEMTPRKQLVSVVYAFKSRNADKFSGLDTSDFVRSGRRNSISTEMIQDDAVTADKMEPDVVSSINGVTNDGGNINLEAGSNVTITPDNANNKITIAAETGAGDNLGNHIATQNIQLNHHWLSGDGDNEGIYMTNTSGKVGIGTSNPQERLDVAGVVRSSQGGFKFPDGTVQTTAFTGVSNAWKLTGNSGTNETDNFIGTTDDVSLNFRVNNVRALKLSPGGISPNVIGGFQYNRAKSGVNGGFIGGGGFSGKGNLVADHYGTVSGGADNRAGSDDADRTNSQYATVAGGESNVASNEYSTVSGGINNHANGKYSTIGGGQNNTTNNNHTTVAGGGWNSANAYRSTIGGGDGNIAGSRFSTISGGYKNKTIGNSGQEFSTVGGGRENTAGGNYATVPGGRLNEANGDYSFAAGYKAKANHTGSFVWSDKSGEEFSSSGSNQFLIRANGGVGIGTNAPAEALDVNGNIHASGSISSGGSITIDGTNNKITSTSGKIDFDNENLVTSGKVGIGNNNPSAPLDVEGEVKSDSVNTSNLLVTGAYKGNIGPNGGAPFPRPAYDSGWINLESGESKQLTHNIGGNPENYVVDMQNSNWGVSNLYISGARFYQNGVEHFTGAYYHHLTNSTISVRRQPQDLNCPAVRVRIWVYK